MDRLLTEQLRSTTPPPNHRRCRTNAFGKYTRASSSKAAPPLKTRQPLGTVPSIPRHRTRSSTRCSHSHRHGSCGHLKARPTPSTGASSNLANLDPRHRLSLSEASRNSARSGHHIERLAGAETCQGGLRTLVATKLQSAPSMFSELPGYVIHEHVCPDGVHDGRAACEAPGWLGLRPGTAADPQVRGSICAVRCGA